MRIHIIKKAMIEVAPIEEKIEVVTLADMATMVARIQDSAKRIANITDCHPVDADRRDRIHNLSKLILDACGKLLSTKEPRP